MADKRSDGDTNEPTLELPKLFGRRRRRTRADGPAPEPVVEPSPVEDTPVQPVELSTGPTTEEDSSTTETGRSTAREGYLASDHARSTTEPVSSPEPGARRAQRNESRMPPRLAAVLTGLVVGIAGTLLTYGSQRGCEILTGTGSCGEGPGLLLLVAIFAVMVLLGGVLLKLWGVVDPQSTSFLAVGITAVVVMLTLLEAVFSPWMFVVVPLVTTAAYMVALWVTTRFAEASRDQAGVDVR